MERLMYNEMYTLTVHEFSLQNPMKNCVPEQTLRLTMSEVTNTTPQQTIEGASVLTKTEFVRHCKH